MKRVNQLEIYSDHWEKILLEKYLLDNGKGQDYVISELNPYVLIVPIVERNKVILFKEYTMGSQTLTLNFLSGYIQKDENVFQAAKRAVSMKTTWSVENLRYIGSLYENVMRSRNKYYIVLANIKKKKLKEQHDKDYNKIQSEIILPIHNLFNMQTLQEMNGAVSVSVLPFLLHILKKSF